MLKNGDVVGGYEITSVLGAGGMGVVYQARHIRLGSKHALKMLADIYVASPGVRARFEAEGTIQATMRHPHIARVTDLIEEPNQLGLVLDLIEGPSLQDALDTERKGAWSASNVVRFLLPIADAMAFAHGHEGGVVHRDLKPANIMLDGGRIDHPIIVDFGIAKLLSSEMYTRTGSRLGTVPYMAPEQFDGISDVDARVDVFALGMMAWELLTGTLPMEPESTRQVMSFYSGQLALPPIEELAAHTPPSLANLVATMTAMDRDRRFMDGRALLRALQHVHGELESATGDETLEPRAPTAPQEPVAPPPDPVPAAVSTDHQSGPQTTPHEVAPRPRPTETLAASIPKSIAAVALAAAAFILAFVFFTPEEEPPETPLDVGTVVSADIRVDRDTARSPAKHKERESERAAMQEDIARHTQREVLARQAQDVHQKPAPTLPETTDPPRPLKPSALDPDHFPNASLSRLLTKRIAKMEPSSLHALWGKGPEELREMLAGAKPIDSEDLTPWLEIYRETDELKKQKFTLEWSFIDGKLAQASIYNKGQGKRLTTELVSAIGRAPSWSGADPMEQEVRGRKAQKVRRWEDGGTRLEVRLRGSSRGWARWAPSDAGLRGDARWETVRPQWVAYHRAAFAMPPLSKPNPSVATSESLRALELQPGLGMAHLILCELAYRDLRWADVQSSCGEAERTTSMASVRQKARLFRARAAMLADNRAEGARLLRELTLSRPPRTQHITHARRTLALIERRGERNDFSYACHRLACEETMGFGAVARRMSNEFGYESTWSLQQDAERAGVDWETRWNAKARNCRIYAR